jgi:hypothetical protein
MIIKGTSFHKILYARTLVAPSLEIKESSKERNEGIMTILIRVTIFLLFMALLTSSISTAGEALKQKAQKPGYQENVSMSSSLAGGEKDGNPILQDTNGISPKETPQPPSAPKGLRVLKKSK